MKTHPLSHRLVARARKDDILVAAALGVFLVAYSNKSLAQVLELPPSEVGEESDKAPESKSAQEKGNTPEGGPHATQEEESETKPDAPHSTSTDASTDASPKTPQPTATSAESESHGSDSGAHDKAEESGHSGESRPARPTGLGSGLIWFAAAFVVLVVAIFVFT